MKSYVLWIYSTKITYVTKIKHTLGRTLADIQLQK